jgi:hypothetical protein
MEDGRLDKFMKCLQGEIRSLNDSDGTKLEKASNKNRGGDSCNFRLESLFILLVISTDLLRNKLVLSTSYSLPKWIIIWGKCQQIGEEQARGTLPAIKTLRSP